MTLDKQVRELMVASRLERSAIMNNHPGFEGEWIAVPRADFDRLRAIVNESWGVGSALADTMIESLEDREAVAGDDASADRLFPNIADPDRELAKFLFPGTRIQRDWVISRYEAGEPIESVAHDFGLDVEMVKREMGVGSGSGDTVSEAIEDRDAVWRGDAAAKEGEW